MLILIDYIYYIYELYSMQFYKLLGEVRKNIMKLYRKILLLLINS